MTVGKRDRERRRADKEARHVCETRKTSRLGRGGGGAKSDATNSATSVSTSDMAGAYVQHAGGFRRAREQWTTAASGQEVYNEQWNSGLWQTTEQQFLGKRDGGLL